MKNNNSPFARPSVRILLSVVLLTLCFLMNRFFKIENAPWSLLQFGLSVALILVAAACILKAISQLTLAKKQATEKPKFDPEHPVKIWTHEELFNYLEADDMVDLDIDHEGGLRVGTASDGKTDKFTGRFEFFDKAYYINDQEYSDLSQFKAQFAAIHPEETVRVLRASLDDNDVTLP